MTIACRRILLAIFCVLAVFFIAAETSFAQNTAGIKLVPTTIETAADPGQTLIEELTITNISNEEKEFYLYKRNIKGVDRGGIPIFAEEAEPTGFEMSGWIRFENTSVVLAPGEERVLPITIVVPADASPGSHFGGIFTSVEPPRLREIGAGVGYEVASIVSIRISGEVIDQARIRSFSTNKLFYGSKDVTFNIEVENQGNILIRPRGPLTISSMFGGDPEVFIVNDKLSGVFPGTVRELEPFVWQDEGIGFGRYEAVVALVYDGDRGQKTIDASLIFWVFPVKIIVPTAITLFVLFLAGYFMTKMYVRNAIVRSSGGVRHITPQRYRKQVGISRFMFVTVTVLVVLLFLLILLFLYFA